MKTAIALFFLASTAAAQTKPFQNIEMTAGGIIIRDVELLPLCESNQVKLIDQGFEMPFRTSAELCGSLTTELGHGGCGVLIGDATIKKNSDGIFTWDEITNAGHLRDGCQPVANMFPRK